MGRDAPLEVAQVDRAAHARQGGLAAQRLEVRARVAAGVLSDVLQVEVGVCRHVAGVDIQDMQSRFGVGEPDLDLVVEASRAPESGVEGGGAVRGSDDADTPEVVHAVHEGEELGDEGCLEALAHHVARGGEGVYLVEEHDRGALDRASLKMERSLASLWPQYLLSISGPATAMKCAPLRARPRAPGAFCPPWRAVVRYPCAA